MTYQPKSYRKFLATSVAAAMVATVAAPMVLAEETTVFTDTDGVSSWAGASIDYLVAKGAIEGMGDNIFAPAADLTRAQAATILARTLDLTVDMDAETDFEDTATHWSSPYVKAIQNQLPGVIDGYTDGTFNPDGTISRQEMAKMTVKAYDLKLDANADVSFTDNTGWGKDDIQVLASLGIVNGYGDMFKPNGKVTRAESVVFVHRSEVDSVRVPVAYNAAAVTSVSAINAMKLEVNFNKEVNKVEAETASNYSFVGLTAGTLWTPELQADGKTVILTLDNAIANGTTYVATVSEISTKADANEKTAKFTTTLTFSDTTRPTLSNVSYPSPGKAVLNFSEDLSTEGNVKVYDGITDVTASVYTSAHVAGDNSITLTGLNSSKEYKVVITGAKDQSNNLIAAPIEVMVKNTTTDTVAPTITSLYANSVGTVKVQFTEAVTAIATELTVTVDGYDNAAVTTQTFDSKTNTMTISGLVSAVGTPLVNGSVHAVSVSGYEDAQGNDGLAYSKVLSFSNAAPTLTTTSVSKVGTDTYAVLTFDKDVTLDTSLEVTGSYVTPENIYKTVDAADITEATDITVDGTDSKKVWVKVTGKEAGAYSLSLPVNFVANAGVMNDKAISVKFTLSTSADSTKPLIQNVLVPGDTMGATTVERNTVYVQYSKTMSAAALNTNNYSVDGTSIFKDAVFIGDKTLVKLTLKDSSISISGDRNFTINNSVTGENNVAIDAYTAVETFSENVKPVLSSANLVDGNTIALVFSEYINDTNFGATGDVEVYIDGVKSAIGTIASGTANDNKFEVNLSTAVTAAQLSSSTITVKVLDTTDVTDMATVANTLTSGTVVTVTK